MNNIELALNIFMDLVDTITAVGNIIRTAKSENRDITPSELQQIVNSRDSVLNKLKEIANGTTSK